MTPHAYVQLRMEDYEAIIFTLDLKEPVEISDFVAAFAGLGSQFEGHLKKEHPDLKGEVKIYVKEVRKGSIEAELIPLAYNTVISVLDHAQIVTKFVKAVAKRVGIMSKPGGRLTDPTKTELTYATIGNSHGGCQRSRWSGANQIG